ncbi:transcobalamin-2-like [Actinia tenebrosa]|uniref:Transcobalamin-2-like n=1 Tax=Actinia tenebrosa TaxID=6105 RepID=A0A6P8HM71_ACTTE|nr:transcobalamin-2-like [Actinia tenebrosa]
MYYQILVIFCVLVFPTPSNGFCGSRKLNGDLARSSTRAAEFLRGKLEENFRFDPEYTRAVVIRSLRLAGYTVDMLNNLGTNLDDLANELHQQGLGKISTGRIAYYVQGVLSICQDPRAFHGHNLIKRLEDGIKAYPVVGFNHPFPYSLAVLSLCMSGHGEASYSEYALKIRNTINQIINSTHSKDTVAMATMALACMRDKTKNDAICSNVLKKTIKVATNWMMTKQNSNGSFGNSITTAHVAKALLSAGITPNRWNCHKALNFILQSQGSDGSFQTYIMSTAQVMPVLIGAIPSDVTQLECPRNITAVNKNPITVCVRLEFLTTSSDGKLGTPPPPVSLTVLNGTNTYDILVLASKQHDCYKFNTTMSAWGNSLTSICGVAKDPANKKYWMIYSDPTTLTPTGIDSYRPKDGSCVIFKYEKLNFR